MDLLDIRQGDDGVRDCKGEMDEVDAASHLNVCGGWIKVRGRIDTIAGDRLLIRRTASAAMISPLDGFVFFSISDRY